MFKSTPFTHFMALRGFNNNNEEHWTTVNCSNCNWLNGQFLNVAPCTAYLSIGDSGVFDHGRRLRKTSSAFLCVFAVHLFSEHEVLSAKNLKRSDDLTFANFVRNFFHYLNATNVGSHLVHAMGICAHMCVDTNLLCLSYNVATQPDMNGPLSV